MEQASATLTQLLQWMQQQSAMAFTSDPKAASRELERRKAECYNREEGTLNQQDNYNCPPCGIIWRHRRPGRQVGDPYEPKGSYMIPFNEQLYSVGFGRLAAPTVRMASGSDATKWNIL